MMECKGYVAAIEYDDIEELFYGHVVNSGPVSIVTFAAGDVEGLKREFRISIDQYLQLCEDAGIEPQKPFSGRLDLQIGSDLHHRVTMASMEDGVSLNAWIEEALEEKVAAAGPLAQAP